jgi:hypothetical protein
MLKTRGGHDRLFPQVQEGPPLGYSGIALPGRCTSTGTDLQIQMQVCLSRLRPGLSAVQGTATFSVVVRWERHDATGIGLKSRQNILLIETWRLVGSQHAPTPGDERLPGLQDPEIALSSTLITIYWSMNRRGRSHAL